MNNKPPCKGCQQRSETCHTTCEGYISFKKEREAIQHAKNMERTAEPTYLENLIYKKSGGWSVYNRRFRPQRLKKRRKP